MNSCMAFELCKMMLMLNYFDANMNHEGLLLDKVANNVSSNQKTDNYNA
jgi:hypothetical protein